jgi:hypothetical protein
MIFLLDAEFAYAPPFAPASRSSVFDRLHGPK